MWAVRFSDRDLPECCFSLYWAVSRVQPLTLANTQHSRKAAAGIQAEMRIRRYP